MSAKPWDPNPGSADLLRGFGGSNSNLQCEQARFRAASQQSRTLQDAIRDFIAATPILSLFRDGLAKVATTNGGEYAGPCPTCGGDDRMRVWPTPREGKARAWCRGCNADGDVVHWAMRLDHRDPSERGAVAKFLVDRGFLDARAEHPPQDPANQVPATERSRPSREPASTPAAPAARDTSGAATAAVRALFAAWDEHVGYAPLSPSALIAYAGKYPTLLKAFESVAGSPPDPQRLAAHLASLAGVTVNDHQIIRDGESAWRLASMWSIDLSAKQAKTREMFRSQEDWQ